ncbi:MAG: YlxR family protein [Lachnospiraceae bacterium]|nr:YlxR family protein [Lachnospiraceae bacterium]
MAKKTPLRKCVGCGEMIAKKEMLRIIKTKDNDIRLDPTGKENGRGAYLHFDAGCLEKAVKSKGLERSFKMSIDADIYNKLSEELIDIEQQ